VKYFLDTNIFMYAAGRDHPLKASCVAVLRRVSREELDVLTNTEVLQELLYRYGAIGELQRGLHLARLAVDQVAGEVLPVTIVDMHRAFDLFDRYGTEITGRDAVHAATILNNSLTHIISADSHFDIIEGITRLGPQKAARLKV
jgi:hypothetical protein